ncbi:type I-B CRISPR-associated protein Cas7/Cst2/DevR [Aquifex pyrophilus]
MGGLTLTVITSRASSLNYGENIGNVSILKKVTLGDGAQKTYISDKALKYDIRRKGKEEKGWKLLDEKLKELIEGKKRERKQKNKTETVLDVDEFGKELIKEYEEFDLFGGLFTNLPVKLSYGNSVKRTSPVKLTYAFSVSPFRGDMNFLNNIDAYNRYIKHVEEKSEQAIAYTEEHTSHYVYTITVDLDRIGIWKGEEKAEKVLEEEERTKRIQELLDIILTLDRQIKGRWENLSPIFVIGGIFSVKHPFFMNGVDCEEREGKLLLNLGRLRDALNIVPEGERDNVLVGLNTGYFLNEEEIRKELKPLSVGDVFTRLKEEVKKYYEGS